MNAYQKTVGDSFVKLGFAGCHARPTAPLRSEVCGGRGRPISKVGFSEINVSLPPSLPPSPSFPLSSRSYFPLFPIPTATAALRAPHEVEEDVGDKEILLRDL